MNVEKQYLKKTIIKRIDNLVNDKPFYYSQSKSQEHKLNYKDF